MRLQRIGKRGQAYFRIVVTEHTKKPKGEFLELLGSYDPHKKELKAKKDRIAYWLEKGVQASPTVNNLLVTKNIITAPKKQSWKARASKKAAPAPAAASAPEAPSEQPAA
ncbi:MAG TPA: 30S ribosomal protein S16 [Candidatus Paceibacterota bacterium]|nr:30S ribosomal protein S16 [Candidatus Paceibacterota bacterium]